MHQPVGLRPTILDLIDAVDPGAPPHDAIAARIGQDGVGRAAQVR